MKCEEFQSELPAILDGHVDTTTGEVQKHLAACSGCHEELVGLLECRRLVASLPEVDPPSGFVTRIMARVQETSTRGARWKALLWPPAAKLPLQATAVILIAVMALYLYPQADGPQAPAPTALPEPAAVPPPIATDSPSAPIHADDKQNARATEEKSIPSTPKTPRASSPISVAKPSLPAERQIDPVKQTRRRMPIPAQGVAAGVGPSGAATFREPGFRPFPGERPLSIWGEPVADYELFVRRRPSRESDAQTASAESPDPSAVAEGKAPSGQRSSSIADVLWYTVPQERYEQFKKELAAEATIESESVLAAKDKQSSFRADGPFYVKVIVLTPVERQPR